MAKRHHLLATSLLAATLLSGCSLFSGEEDVVKMSPLPVVENQFKVEKLWDTSVGNGVGDFFSRLRPAYMDGKVYARPVTAKSPHWMPKKATCCGKPAWRKNPASSLAALHRC